MNAHTLMIAASLFATGALAAEPELAPDPTLGGLFTELRCTTRLSSYGYVLDGEARTWLSGGNERIDMVKLKEGTICSGPDCAGARAFMVEHVTQRISYKEVHLRVDESEYIIEIIGDATLPDADISLAVKARPQAKGQSVRSGACAVVAGR